jgi:predicted acyl esterase
MSRSSDADWIVTLIGVYPENIPNDANQPTPFRFSLHGQNDTFRTGHRIMVQVRSPWFPLIAQ